MRSSEKDTVIFLHHFPILVKDELFNKINLINGTELEGILLQHNNVLGLYCGHAHYGAASLFANKMCWISSSTAPVHILENNKCTGIHFSSPCYSLHNYCALGSITSSVIAVEE